jgi:hypothetical protein
VTFSLDNDTLPLSHLDTPLSLCYFQSHLPTEVALGSA